MQSTDKIFKALCMSCASIVGLLVLGIFIQLSVQSADAWSTFGIGFLWSSEWDPAKDVYGAWPNIAGTLMCTLIALIVAIPLAFVSALFITETPDWLSRPLSQGVDLLAAIPSVIYGIWGLFIVVPFMAETVQPWLASLFQIDLVWDGEVILGVMQADPEQGWMPMWVKEAAVWLFGEGYNGFGFVTAGLILALMILPYMSAIMRDVFRMTPPMLKESAYGVGCTRWEATRDVIMRYGIRGILGGIFVGMGRALGETMAVVFVIGSFMQEPEGIFGSGTTIAATLATNFAEANGLQLSSLFALGLILLILSFSIQAFSQYYLHLTSAKRGEAR